MHIDPDQLKFALPEMDGYVRNDRHLAGSLTHRESGYLSEL